MIQPLVMKTGNLWYKEIWTDKENYLFLNPKLEPHALQHLQNLAEYFNKDFTSHIFIASSGTTAAAIEDLKLIALSKQAILASAVSVNQFLKINDNANWLVTLPLFHIGGLSILARAFLSSANLTMYTEKWCPIHLVKYLIANNIHYTSLVPTQVFDIVAAQVTPPKSLKAVVIGGARLDKAIYDQARKLNWPLLPSYGCSELCSQIATANLNSLQSHTYPSLEILDHIQIEDYKHNKLHITSPSLYTAILKMKNKELIKSLANSYFELPDLLHISNNKIVQVIGRPNQFIKILGEGVDLEKLETKVAKILNLPVRDLCIAKKKDPRRSWKLDLYILPKHKRELTTEDLNSQLPSYENLDQLIYTNGFSNELGKKKRNSLEF